MPTIRTSPTLVEVEFNSLSVTITYILAACVFLALAAFVTERFVLTSGSLLAAALSAFEAVSSREKSTLRIAGVGPGATITYRWEGFRREPVLLEAPLSDLQGVVTESIVRRRLGPAHRVCLIIGDRVVPMTRSYGATAPVDRANIQRAIEALGHRVALEEKQAAAEH